ncbi:MAG: hypothetical protein HRT37_10870 [Alteromonadaceae bacterium]|nr:hypothetical protein [Alteromonadaceae bacterium]
MSVRPDYPELKEINAYKKKLNWGEIATIYHMLATSVGELDGILTHGFDSGYKHILDPHTWNLSLLGGSRDPFGNIEVKNKPQIMLQHSYDDTTYELHCFPVVNGERFDEAAKGDPMCPFVIWQPQTMRMLFRISSLTSFMMYNFQSGDEADFELIKFAHFKVQKLISILRESFDIIDIKGYNIAEFYLEIRRRHSNN